MEFLQSFIGAILGCGVGGTIIYLAGQKFIENTTNPKFESIEKKIKEIEENKVSMKDFENHKQESDRKFTDIKNDYVPVKVYETTNKFIFESLKEIKEMVKTLTDKIDNFRR